MKRNKKGQFVKLPKVKKVCEQCEKEFYIPSYKKSQRYCSRKCATLGNVLPKIKKICKKCDKEFWVRPCRYYRKYCSHKCFASTRKGLTNKYFGEGHIVTEEARKKMIKRAKERWKNEEFAKKMFKAFKCSPNKLEKLLIKLLKENNLPYKYVGDGKVWLNGRNPDFINCNGEKQVIELFGDYWHTKKIHSFSDTEWGRKLHYQQYGFNCLIIWEHELKENPNKVLSTIAKFEKLVIK